MLKKNSIQIKILTSFIFFSLFIFIILWAFQILFMNGFYQYEKVKDIKQVGEHLKNVQYSDSFSSILEEVSFEKEVCITITDQYDSIYHSVYFGKGCMMEGSEKTSYLKQFIQSGKDEKSYFFQNTNFGNETILYALKLDNNRYAFIDTSIEPISSTVSILQKQLVIVMFIVLFFSILISFFISKKLSEPIEELNLQAKELGMGHFTNEFNVHSNILELKELSNTLNYARSELGKTDELRRDLLSNVSHDLKTPLTMIKAYAEMSMDLHKNNSKKQEEDMKVIVSEADRLTNLVQDILDLSKMEANTLPIEKKEFDIIELIQKIIKKYDYYQELEHYQIQIHSKIKKGIVVADQKRMEQVIYNLINNAIFYTGDNLKVDVYVSKVDDQLLIEVKDTGEGISEEDLPHIWDRYYKSSKNHQRNIIGTGLGLAIVKNILELHHFSYGVKSKIKKGTTFYFYVPFKK